MKTNVLKFLASMSLLSVTAVGATLGATSAGAATSTITGGNPSSLVPGTIDTYQNFAIVDGNNPISASGLLTSWSYYAQYQAGGYNGHATYQTANNTGQVELVIVQPGASLRGGATVVYVSAPSTPFTTSTDSPSSDRVVTVPLPGGVWVQKGDEVALRFIGPSVVPFSGTPSGGTSGSVLYTKNGATSPSMGSSLTFEGAITRTYSVSVSGITGAGCKDGGYKGFFLNQGACVSAFASQGLTPIGAPSN